MILMACIDDHFGMLFNKRRQSQDRLLRQRMLQLSAGGCLRMSPYTKKQFEDAPQIKVSETFLLEAQPGDYCFTENPDLLPYEEKMEKIILYKWNRSYPSDDKFPKALLENGWKLSACTEFAGSSHPKITEEIYTR